MSFLKSFPILASILFLLAGCGAPKPSAPAPQGRVYPMRGKILEANLSAPEHPTLTIHHEAIPDFVDSEGKATGMNSMTMPFETAPGVALGGIRAGDAVAFDWRVDWAARYAKIEKISKLPPEAALSFGPAAKASDTTTQTAAHP